MWASICSLGVGPGNIRGGCDSARRKTHASMTCLEIQGVLLLPSHNSPTSQVALASLPPSYFYISDSSRTLWISTYVVASGGGLVS